MDRDNKLTERFSILLIIFTAKGGQGNWEYDNDDFHISVSGNGNVPKYTFYSKSDSSNKYQLRFQQVSNAMPILPIISIFGKWIRRSG